MIDVWDIIIIFAIFGLSLQYCHETQDILQWYLPHFVLGLIYLTIKIIIHMHKANYDIWKLSPSAREISDGLLGGILGFIFIYILASMFPLVALGFQTKNVLASTGSIDVVTFVIIIFFQATAEEVLWRGAFPLAIAMILYPITTKLYQKKITSIDPRRLSLAGGQLFGAIIFGLRHIPAYVATFGFHIGIQFVILAILAGMVLGIIALRYGLWSSIIAHRLYNIAVVLGIMT